MKVSVTYLGRVLSIEETIELIEKSNADYIHVDFMDGKFVPTKNFELDEVKVFLKNTRKKLDVHVMVNNPLDYLSTFATLNTEYYTFHYEATNDILTIIDEVKRYGLKVGLAINPETTIEDIKPYLDKIDLVLVMSIKPGWAGQSFIYSSVDKIKELNKLKGDFKIAVDGGVNDTNCQELKLAGVDILVASSYIVKSEDYNERINKLKCL